MAYSGISFGWIRKFNLKILAIGHLVFHTSDYLFDYALYPFVIYKYGPVFGYVIMTLLSAAVCLAISYIYDLLEKDWLGIETVKELVENFFKEEEEIARRSWRGKGKRFLSWIFHKNKIGQFVFLSIKFDPLITTIYMRPGYHLYNGFSKRDWKIFWGSVVVSNAWWTGMWLVGLTAIAELIEKMF